MAEELTTVPVEGPPYGNGGVQVLLALAWPIAALLGVIFLAAAAVVIVALIEAPTETVNDIAQLIAKGQALQRMVALMIIIPALAALAMTGKAPGGAVATAIGTIAGSVLGSLSAPG